MSSRAGTMPADVCRRSAAEDLPRAERDPDRVRLAVGRADVDAALLEPLDVHRPGVHERLDRQTRLTRRAMSFDRGLAAVGDPAAEALDEARHARGRRPRRCRAGSR